MRPDAIWAGQMTSHGYFTSGSQFDRVLKEKGHIQIGDRTDREGIEKAAASARASREEQQKKRMRKVFEKAFGPEGHGICDSNDGTA
jgi:hypothetical protein